MSNSKRDVWPHPAGFPLGSDESRAAARALAQGRNKVDEQLVVRVRFIGGRDIPEKRFAYRCTDFDGKTWEVVIIEPDRTTPEYEEYRARVGLG